MDIWKKVEQDEKYIFSENKNITRDNGKKILEKLYIYLKENLHYYYNGERVHQGYGVLKNDIWMVESNVKGKILEVPAFFKIDDKGNNTIENIVYLSRKNLLEKYYPYYLQFDNEISLNEIEFANYCKESAYYIKRQCDEQNIKNYVLSIFPGYTDKINLYGGSGFHFANIIYYDNKYYLIDITYSQFFNTNRNNLERIGLVHFSGCKEGRFMTIDENRKKVAFELLKNGFIELNENNFKMYLDGFTMSFRNGLYYENTNDFSYQTNYSIDDYISFLKGYDNQVNHEGIENLGFQLRPLKKVFKMNR